MIYDEQKFKVFAYLYMLKVFNFFIRYFMNSCYAWMRNLKGLVQVYNHQKIGDFILAF